MSQISVSGAVSGIDTAGLINSLVSVQQNQQTLLTHAADPQQKAADTFGNLITSLGTLCSLAKKVAKTSRLAGPSAHVVLDRGHRDRHRHPGRLAHLRRQLDGQGPLAGLAERGRLARHPGRLGPAHHHQARRFHGRGADRFRLAGRRDRRGQRLVGRRHRLGRADLARPVPAPAQRRGTGAELASSRSRGLDGFTGARRPDRGQRRPDHRRGEPGHRVHGLLLDATPSPASCPACRSPSAGSRAASPSAPQVDGSAVADGRPEARGRREHRPVRASRSATAVERDHQERRRAGRRQHRAHRCSSRCSTWSAPPARPVSP